MLINELLPEALHGNMARALKFTFVFLLIIALTECVKDKLECSICKKHINNKNKNSYRAISAYYRDELTSCFGPSVKQSTGLICSNCRTAINTYKNTGQT